MCVHSQCTIVSDLHELLTVIIVSVICQQYIAHVAISVYFRLKKKIDEQ